MANQKAEHAKYGFENRIACKVESPRDERQKYHTESKMEPSPTKERQVRFVPVFNTETRAVRMFSKENNEMKKQFFYE